MTPNGHASDAFFFRASLPAGFVRHVYRAAPGRNVALDPAPPRDAIVVVEHGELEILCTAGGCRRFGRGSMIPIGRVSVARLRSVGSRPVVLIAIARASDEFSHAAGSHHD